MPFHAECAFLSSILWHFLSLPQKNIPELPRPMFSKQICSRSFVIDLEYTWPKNNPLPGEINWYYSGVITKVQSGVQCTALYGVQLRCRDRAKRVCSTDRRQASKVAVRRRRHSKLQRWYSYSKARSAHAPVKIKSCKMHLLFLSDFFPSRPEKFQPICRTIPLINGLLSTVLRYPQSFHCSTLMMSGVEVKSFYASVHFLRLVKSIVRINHTQDNWIQKELQDKLPKLQV